MHFYGRKSAPDYIPFRSGPNYAICCDLFSLDWSFQVLPSSVEDLVLFICTHLQLFIHIFDRVFSCWKPYCHRGIVLIVVGSFLFRFRTDIAMKTQFVFSNFT